LNDTFGNFSLLSALSSHILELYIVSGVLVVSIVKGAPPDSPAFKLAIDCFSVGRYAEEIDLIAKLFFIPEFFGTPKVLLPGKY
jgi:hypothetical protein